MSDVPRVPLPLRLNDSRLPVLYDALSCYTAEGCTNTIASLMPPLCLYSLLKTNISMQFRGNKLLINILGKG